MMQYDSFGNGGSGNSRSASGRGYGFSGNTATGRGFADSGRTASGRGFTDSGRTTSDSGRGFTRSPDRTPDGGGSSGNGYARTLQRPVRTPSRILHKWVLIASAAAGMASWFVCQFLYSAFLNSGVPRCVLIGILFAVLCLSVSLVAAVYGNAAAASPIRPGRTSSAVRGDAGFFSLSDTPAKRWLFVVLFPLAVFLAALVLQWIYGMGFSFARTAPTSFIFLIDDSSSMAGSDPAQMRYAAVNDVLSHESDAFPFMIYGFASDVFIIREMMPKSEGIPDLHGSDNGGTAIRLALETVLHDYENGIWTGGSAPKLVLLTDGAPTDFSALSDLNDILRGYVHSGISISSVGLGYADEVLLEGIAQSTGGIFISVDDVSRLREAITTASFGVTTRDLVSTRYLLSGVGMDVALGILRVVFLTVLGILLNIASALAFNGTNHDFWNSVLLSSAFSLVGAVEIELATGAFRQPYRIHWLILWILLAILFAWEYRVIHLFNPRGGKPAPFDSVNTKQGGSSQTPDPKTSAPFGRGTGISTPHGSTKKRRSQRFSSRQR